MAPPRKSLASRHPSAGPSSSPGAQPSASSNGLSGFIPTIWKKTKPTVTQSRPSASASATSVIARRLDVKKPENDEPPPPPQLPPTNQPIVDLRKGKPYVKVAPKEHTPTKSLLATRRRGPRTIQQRRDPYNDIKVVDGVKLDTDELVDGGGQANIFRGIYKNQVVAVRSLRICATMSTEEKHSRRKDTYNEALIWQPLLHPNILLLIGISEELPYAPCFVSKWIEHGTILVFLEKRQESSTINDIIPLLQDVAGGLSYMHDRHHLVHGDVKPANILIDLINGRFGAMLCDFGSAASSRPSTADATSAIQSLQAFSQPYMAPEVFRGGNGITNASDVFSFGAMAQKVVDQYTLRRRRLPGAEIATSSSYTPQPASERDDLRLSLLRIIISSCLKVDPQERLAMKLVHSKLKRINSRNHE